MHVLTSFTGNSDHTVRSVFRVSEYLNIQCVEKLWCYVYNKTTVFKQFPTVCRERLFDAQYGTLLLPGHAVPASTDIQYCR
jgi:hypothetical protein